MLEDNSWETDDALIAAGDQDSTEESGTDGDGSAKSLSGDLQVRTNANFRTGASTSFEVIRVLPTGTRVSTVSTAAGGKWTKISYRGLHGYMATSLLVTAPSDEQQATINAAREAVLERSRAALGYSYWRGHSKWVPYQATPTEPPGYIAGKSTGGTDCSGLVGKVWQVPAWNTDTTDDKRAYVTRHFRYSMNKEWVRVSRSEVIPADAYVWNDGNKTGHIVIVRGTDAWGAVKTMEAKGKQYGIVEDTRKNLSPVYVGIRRRGL